MFITALMCNNYLKKKQNLKILNRIKVIAFIKSQWNTLYTFKKISFVYYIIITF